MKRKNKLPRYWLGTKTPTSLGYQPNYGIGNAQFTSTSGESLEPEVRSIRNNIIPNALGKAQTYGSFALNALDAWKTAKAAKTAATSTAETAGKGAATAGKAASSSLGTVIGGIGGAIGLTDMGIQLFNNQDHRTAGQMRNTLATNTYTTDLGNTYTTHSGPNGSAELNYSKAQRTAKNVDFTTTALGTGASIGSIFGPYGTAIGAGAGLLVGLGASLLGFGDTEEETRQQMNTLSDAVAMENRMNESVAYDKDAKQAFYGRTQSGNIAQAAKGKAPQFAKGKVNAMVSNGEIQGNLKEGWAFQYGGIPNNDDKIKTHVDKSDYIISNPFVPYVKATGDIVGALTMQDMINRNKKDYKSAPLKAKCGKLPGFKLGDFGEYAMTAVPNIAQILAATKQYNIDDHMPVYNAPLRADYSAARNNAYRIAGLMPNMQPVYNAIDQQTANQRYNVMRMPGAGYGGRMVMLDSANRAALKTKADARYQAEVDNLERQAKALQMAANIDSHETDVNNQNQIVVRGMTQQANAAKYNALAQDRKNMVTPLGPLFKDLQDIRKYHEAKDLKERMVELYENQQGIDKAYLDEWLKDRNKDQNAVSSVSPKYQYRMFPEDPIKYFNPTSRIFDFQSPIGSIGNSPNLRFNSTMIPWSTYTNYTKYPWIKPGQMYNDFLMYNQQPLYFKSK